MMKKSCLKVGLGLLLGMAALSLTASSAQAQDTKCPITNPPVDSWKCNGNDETVERTQSCEEPTEDKRTVGGCYDTDGDCYLTPYTKHTVTATCQIGGAITVAMQCTGTQYEEGGEDGDCIEV